MPIVIGSNISSLHAQRLLSQSSDASNDVYARLSSGSRINKASDDAAGLAIATSLRVDTRVYSQAVKNVNDGVSLLSIGEGALRSLSEITQRQLELAEQAANGAYSLKQRKAMDVEANALVDEYNRVVATTKFNGIGVFDGSLINGLQIQSGYSDSGSVSYNVGNQLSRNVGNGTFQSATEYGDGVANNPIIVKAADVNGDGKQDLVSVDRNGNTFSVFIGNGDGTFNARVSYSAGNCGLILTDINGDGKIDVLTTISGASGNFNVSLGNGDGSFKAKVTYASSSNAQAIAVGDLNHDGIQDVVVGDKTGILTVYQGNANGTFNAAVTYSKGNVTNVREDIALADFNNDGNLDIVTNDGNDGTVSVLFGNGNGSFSARTIITLPGTPSTIGAVKAVDVNHDGISDIIANGQSAMFILQSNGDGTFAAIKSYSLNGGNPEGLDYADLNGDGIGDIITSTVGGSSVYTVLLGNSDGSFSGPINGPEANSVNTGIIAADFNGDGVLDLAATDATNSSLTVSIANKTKVASIGRLDILTQANARAAIDTLQSNLTRIQLEQGVIGANLSRMSSTISTLQTSKLGAEGAYSNIMDVDVASATGDLTKNTILQQADVAILSHVNQEPALVLKLLNS